MGGFGDVPTKQDKFKQIEFLNLSYEDAEGNKIELSDKLYIINSKSTERQKKFEEILIPEIKSNLTNEHPYKKPQQLEVVIGITTTTSRYNKVDIDNLVKFILDCFNGLVYEDDSQDKQKIYLYRMKKAKLPTDTEFLWIVLSLSVTLLLAVLLFGWRFVQAALIPTLLLTSLFIVVTFIINRIRHNKKSEKMSAT